MDERGDPQPPDPTIEWSGAVPPADSDAAPTGLSQPWYRRNAVLTAVVIGAIVVLGFGWILTSRSDEGSTSSPVSTLRFLRVDEAGDALVRSVSAEVSGETGGGFVWLSPNGARAPQPAATATDETSGVAVFQWAPDIDVAEPDAWRSEIAVFEEFGAEESLGGSEFECRYERVGQEDGLAVLRVTFDDAGDLRAPRIAEYRFLGYRFQPGDRTTCVVFSGPGGAAGSRTVTPPPATSEPPVGTGLPPETTLPVETQPASTLPGETLPPTSQPATTQPGTTQPGTTQPATTVPPTTQPGATATAMSVIDSRPDLAAFSDLIDFAGLRELFSDPTARLTVFAPDNAALTDLDLVPSELAPNDVDDIRELILAHVHRGAALSRARLLALTEIAVEAGDPHEIDPESEPPTVGFVDIVEFDVAAGNSVLHILDDVLAVE